MDHHLGHLFGQLKESDLFDNTLIIITSDHGEAFGERNFVQHGMSVYQDQVYVPLLIKYPDSNESAIIEQTVSSVDILPTILDVLEIDMKLPDNHGISLRKINPADQRFVIAESYPNGGLRRRHDRFKRIERAIVSGPFKLIQSTTGKQELYNLAEDPDELTDLSEIRVADTQRLKGRFSEWLNTTHPIRGAQNNSDFNPEVLRRLKALGYIK